MKKSRDTKKGGRKLAKKNGALEGTNSVQKRCGFWVNDILKTALKGRQKKKKKRNPPV